MRKRKLRYKQYSECAKKKIYFFFRLKYLPFFRFDNFLNTAKEAERASRIIAAVANTAAITAPLLKDSEIRKHKKCHQQLQKIYIVFSFNGMYE
jgi:hypothetical protein